MQVCFWESLKHFRNINYLSNQNSILKLCGQLCFQREKQILGSGTSCHASSITEAINDDRGNKRWEFLHFVL